MKRTIFTTILNISNINIPEEFGLSSELFLFDNPDNYMQMDQNMVAVNEPFTTTQGDHVAETNYMTNGIVFQIREVIKKAVDDEDFSFYNTTNQWIIKKNGLDNKKNIKDIRVSRWPLENSHENRESKTLRRCKNCHGIGHYAKTCTAG
ncbi:hypothetical protein RhiirA4_456999 [Rhizophagus irregularis]|uniref:Uncharacterized protein n=1 Tax=Rhizophagus irregularis TaxID=588596 RepID=A0A2I1G914_9GLOM|nr:hypothetical protein RhiirA4_456999 [Rhizophagus irregularis]